MSGHTAHLAGLAAEDIVAKIYTSKGFHEERRRWRGPVGEIDLILSQNDRTIFVEVKKSKSFAAAAERLSTRQLHRIEQSAADYLASQPAGQNSEARVDVALVDATGAVEILENVTMH